MSTEIFLKHNPTVAAVTIRFQLFNNLWWTADVSSLAHIVRSLMIHHSAKLILFWHYTAGLMKHGRCSSSKSWSHQFKEISVSCEHWIGIWKVACNEISKWNEIWWGSRPASSGCVSWPPTASCVFAACQFRSFGVARSAIRIYMCRTISVCEASACLAANVATSLILVSKGGEGQCAAWKAFCRSSEADVGKMWLSSFWIINDKREQI